MIVRETSLRLTHKFLKSKSQQITSTNKKAIVFAPHEDDETFGCGGAIAIKRSQGIPVKVVFITDGRYGRPSWITPDNIISHRQQEATDALNVLGVTPEDIYFLSQEDSKLSDLSPESHQELVTKIQEIIKNFQPEEVYVTYQYDKHADHQASYNIVTEAIAKSGISVEILQYPIWGFWQNPLLHKLKKQDLARTYHLPIHQVHQQKLKAINSYKSQTPGLPPSMVEQAASDYEIFFKTSTIKNK
ncbi:hypothetical protein IJ00_20085 [Calothrix sp. 336/3]|nr:hypothetical protein IJ00_20085 [Calothrix sp. 336/3]